MRTYTFYVRWDETPEIVEEIDAQAWTYDEALAEARRELAENYIPGGEIFNARVTG